MTTCIPIRSGELALRLVRSGSGQTRVADLRQRYPQRMTTALHCDPRYPDAAVICVQSPSGGAFSDDELRTDIDAGPGTHLQLTTQAATQVFAGSGSGARHQLTFTLRSGAIVEYVPKTIIPHRDARYSQRIDIELAPTATYLGWDALASGRLGHGERFAYRLVDNGLTARVGGRTLLRDRQVLEHPSAQRLVGADYLATLLLLAPWADCSLVLARVRAALSGFAHGWAGASELPDGLGVVIRLTTDSAPELARLRESLVHSARRALIGASEDGDE